MVAVKILKKGELPPLPQKYVVAPSKTFRRPPLDGTMSIAQMCDWHAEHSPEHPMFEYLDSEGQVTTVKWKDVGSAMHRGGWLIKSALEKHMSMKGKRVLIAVVASSENVAYTFIHLAIQRLGHMIFPISIRNSPVAIAHLLAKTEVDHVLVGQEDTIKALATAAFDILEKNSDKVPSSSLMPIFSDLMPVALDEPVPQLPPIQFELDETSIVMHSSGSTAFPKPVRWTYFRMASLSRWPYYGDRDLTGWRVAVHAIPMFHGMGLAQIAWAASTGLVMTCYRPEFPTRVYSPDEMLEEACALNSDLLFCVPSFAEAWAKSPKQVEMLKQTRGVFYGGGPMDRSTGDYLTANGVTIYTLYGCTEYGIMNVVLPKDPAPDWEYFSFPDQCRTHMVPEDELGNSRLILVSSDYQVPAVVNCEVDGLAAYDTNDVLAPHPNVPGYWKLYGRADDQIMHSNGEKTNPGPLENILNQDPHVNNAIVFGRGRFNAGVLIEPRPEYRFDPADQQKLAEFRNRVCVEKMNEYAPQHSRLFKEMIIVTSPLKPFTYTAKNTPRRHAIINDYEKEIQALYDAVDETTQADLPPPRSWSPPDSKEFTRTVVRRVLDYAIGDSDDLFQSGCDSLQATWIRNSLLHALRETTAVDTRSIPINFVYNHSSIMALAEYMSSLATSSSVAGDVDEAAAIQAMHDMLQKYSHDFPVHSTKTEAHNFPSRDTILVTGTTGGLGSTLLAQLVATPEVEKVYAMNRKGGVASSERQREILLDRGYDVQAVMHSPKVKFIEIELDKEDLGLAHDVYEEIRNSVTHIIHNAWPVNFNLALNFFESSVRGVRYFIDLALKSPHVTPPRIIFISSEGVLRHIDHSRRIKEEFVDARVSVGQGYSESKWVSEQLLALASRKTPLQTLTVREGQITGSANGGWNVQEWVPALIKSSIYLGCIPMVPGDVSWIPSVATANALIEARNTATDISPIHLAHPRPVPWKVLFEPLSRRYGLQPVTYGMWYSRLQQSAEWAGIHTNGSTDSNANGVTTAVVGGHVNKKAKVSNSNHRPSTVTATNAETASALAANPALKLLSFFDACNSLITQAQREGKPIIEALGLPQLDVTKARTLAAKTSLSEQNLPKLSEEDMMKWVGYWERVGFLPVAKTV